MTVEDSENSRKPLLVDTQTVNLRGDANGCNNDQKNEFLTQQAQTGETRM